MISALMTTYGISPFHFTTLTFFLSDPLSTISLLMFNITSLVVLHFAEA